MIEVVVVLTASNTDVLASTDLANIPAGGQLDLWIAASQNDWTITVTGPGNEPVKRSQKILQRTNGMPILSDDPPLSLVVTQGGHYFVNLTVVTAGTGVVIARYSPVEELV